jgi:hypothetical protein
VIHKANHNSARLKPILEALMKAGPQGMTSMELALVGKTVAIGTSISELRHNGFDIECSYEGRNENGRKLFRYVLSHTDLYDQQLEAIG